MSNTKERSKTYGNPDYKGKGIIKCRVCGGKLRDHPMEPCSQLGERVLYISDTKTMRGEKRED